MTPTIIRASSLSGHPDCPRRSAAKIFRSDIRAAGFDLHSLPSSVGAPVGSGVHGGVFVTLAEKAETGIMSPEDVATDAALDVLRQRIADEGAMFDKETPTLNDAEQQVVRMVKVYRAQVAPNIHPVTVEQRLEAAVSPGIVLSGQSDLVAWEPNAVDDLKTGKMKSRHAAQLGAYALLNRSHGIPIATARTTFIQRVALAKPQPPAEVEEYDVGACETAAVAILRQIAAEICLFRDGDPTANVLPGDPWAFPANPSSKLCSSKWCPAWGTDFCREHAPAKE